MKAKSPTPRKKPLQNRSRQTVAVILEATRLCLQKHGLEGLSTTRVSKKAGVSIGTLYQYYPNKESLVAALVESIGEREEILIGSVLTRAVGLRETLAEIIRIYFHVVSENLSLYLPLIEALYTICQKEDVQRLERAGVRRMRKLLESFDNQSGRNLDKTAFIVSYSYIGLIRFAAMVEPRYLKDPVFVEGVIAMVTNHVCGPEN